MADALRRSGPSLDELRAEARYARDRLALYRARALTGRATSQMRMLELQRAADLSEERLRLATGTPAPR